jgi:RecJ-like exonuclease
VNVRIGHSSKYGGDSDTFTEDIAGHMSRCDDVDGIEGTRCPICKGRGKVQYTFGTCNKCGGGGGAVACFKHKVYWY